MNRKRVRPGIASLAFLALTLLIALTLALPPFLALAAAPAPGDQAPNPAGAIVPTRARATATAPARTPATRATPTPEEVLTEAVPIGEECGSAASLAPADWSLIVCDGFDNNDLGWTTGTDSDEYADSTREVQDGVYAWDQQAKKAVFSSTRWESDPIADFYLAVDARQTSGKDTADYGLLMRRVDSDNFYMFSISDSGYFQFNVMIAGEWQTLLDWTPSTAILPGEFNRIAAQVEGPNFVFWVNEEQVGEYIDDQLTEGRVGLTSGLSEGESGQFEFDNFELRVPAGVTVATPSVTDTPTRAARPTATRAARLTPTRTAGRATPTRAARLTPTATRAPSRTVTPAPIGECPDDPLAPADWTPALCDVFDSNVHDWPLNSTDDWAEITRIVRWTYHWELKALKDVYYSTRDVNTANFTDFYYAADIRRVDGLDTTNYGIQFRWVDTGNFYAFSIADTGSFKVELLYRNAWQTLQDWTTTDAIKAGDWNRLAVQAEGSRFTFWINEQQVAEFSDSRLKSGLIGVSTTLNANEEVTMDFDNLVVKVRNPEEAVAPAPMEAAPSERIPTAVPARATPTPTEAAEAPVGNVVGPCLDEITLIPDTWTNTLCTNFESNEQEWAEGEEQGNLANATRTVQGTYAWDIDAKSGAYLSVRPATRIYGDFYAAVDVQLIAGDPATYFGIQFRWTDAENFYAFSVRESNEFKIDLLNKNEWQTLLDWTEITSVIPGEANRIAVKAQGNSFTFYVNGEEVGAITDSRLKRGELGLAVNVAGGETASVDFDNMDVRAPAAR